MSKKKQSQRPDTSAAAATPAASKKKRRPVLELYLENITKMQTLVGRTGVAFRAWAAQATAESSEASPGTIAARLTESMASLAECVPRINETAETIKALISSGFVPGSAPKAPKFAVGEIVKVDDEWIGKYTKSGLYKAEELWDLEISAIGDKEVIAKTKGGREVLIRSMSHLEATSLEAQP